MTRTSVALGVAAVAVAAVITAACGGGSEQPATESAPASSTPAVQAGMQAVDINFRTQPDPVVMGENTLEATVMQGGKPVTDAMVSTEFFMAAMPSMNMPEMRSKAELMHQGNGIYRGKGQVTMAGTWDVTVMVMRGGQDIGSRKMTLTAK
ncbi:MAG: FixH family protein [Vicinamibacterales bacterium]